MKTVSDGVEHHRQRSQFIRDFVQSPERHDVAKDRHLQRIPRTIIQFWHDLELLPDDIKECVASWSRWEASEFKYRLFDTPSAALFISASLGERYRAGFDRCYHPAMQADYFRMCYLFVEGGFYVDADDVCVASDIGNLFEDGRLKLQPLCYDNTSGSMVEPAIFLREEAHDPNWTFYFNNNPLIASRGHPIVERALNQATAQLELDDEVLPEIQATTGPGNLSKCVFEFGSMHGAEIHSELVVLREWGAIAATRWALRHRGDARNWRLSNQKKFNDSEDLTSQ